MKQCLFVLSILASSALACASSSNKGTGGSASSTSESTSTGGSSSGATGSSSGSSSGAAASSSTSGSGGDAGGGTCSPSGQFQCPPSAGCMSYVMCALDQICVTTDGCNDEQVPGAGCVDVPSTQQCVACSAQEAALANMGCPPSWVATSLSGAPSTGCTIGCN